MVVAEFGESVDGVAWHVFDEICHGFVFICHIVIAVYIVMIFNYVGDG